MDIREGIPLGPKTTMRIGGMARYYAEILTREDLGQAAAFARERNLPLIVLGSGSNTIFAEGVIEALVIRIKADGVEPALPHPGTGAPENERVIVHSGKILASLVNELAERGLDLSALTGIPGTVGGAVFGNAGQGPKGIWIDSFIVNVTAYIDGAWKTFTKEECRFGYRESLFKELQTTDYRLQTTPIIWEVTLSVPRGEPAAIKTQIEGLLQKRITTQPHMKTAGSCFKAVGETPAWQLIDRAGLRGQRIGGVEISPKHANFLLNTGSGTFTDAKRIVETVKEKVPQDLEVEMRFVEHDGSIAF